MNKIKLLLRVSRPINWLLTFLVFLAGFIVSGAKLTILPLFQLFLMTFPLNIILNGINDVYDYKKDKNNPGKKSLIKGMPLPLKYHPLVKKVSLTSAILLIMSSLLTFNLTNFIILSFGLFIAYFYSAPPIRFKEKPPFDSIANGMYFLGPFALGFSFGGSIWQLPIEAYVLTGCVIAIHAYSTLGDYHSDKLNKVKTFATTFGQKVTSFFTFLMFTLLSLITRLQASFRFFLVSCSILFLITSLFPSKKLIHGSYYYTLGGGLISITLFIFLN